MSEKRQAPAAVEAPNNDFALQSHDTHFPETLRHVHPPVRELLGRGDQTIVTNVSRQPGLAIVGARRASPQGQEDARWFARVASEHGLTIISGLAHGVDTAAHEGALEGEGGTIAVLAHGRDHVYPRHNADLLERIIRDHGAAVTEYPDGTPPRPFQFPCRNRIIAGLAQAVLVVEAAPRSGSLITARHALDVGVSVFVVPGSIHALEHQGGNSLIREGAQLVQSPEELLADLGIPAKDRKTNRKHITPPLFAGQLDENCAKTLSCLSHQASTIDDLSARSKMTLDRLHGCLLMLELAHQAVRLPDGRWLKLEKK